MCGILAIFSKSGVSLTESADALQSIRHRGPDDEGMLLGTFSGDKALPVKCQDTVEDIVMHSELPSWESQISENWQIVMGHRRLSILDLSSAGHQPMSWSDGRYWISYNGEVYNYREIRIQLEELGVNFVSSTDTEVILAAYAQWGEECLSKFTGMWAFVIWDRLENIVFLARDPFGIKPLYYSSINGSYAFCSEIKGLLKLSFVPKRQDAQAVYDYLVFSRVECPEGRTLFEGVSELPPATCAKLSLEGEIPLMNMRRYWNPVIEEPSKITLKEAADEIYSLFMDSVDMHLRSDVPIGAALSGGIDSSAIVCAMRKIGGDNLDIHTFSYLADDPSLCEEKWMNLVGKTCSTSMHKTMPFSGDIPFEMDTLIRCQDLPFGSTSIYAQHRIFRLVSESGIKVTLDGQGPDEMFSGYTPFRKFRAISLFASGNYIRGWKMAVQSGDNPFKVLGKSLLPKAMTPAARKFFRASDFPCWINPEWVEKNSVSTGFKSINYPKRDLLRHSLHDAVLHSSIPSLLRYEDRNSMHFSVESRVPFLTTSIAEAAFKIAEHHLIDTDGTTKHVLRHALRDLVPDDILDRQDKIGFGTPEALWLMQVKTWVLDVLDPKRTEILGIFDSKKVYEQAFLIVSGIKPYNSWLWRTLNYVIWVELNSAESFR